MKVRRLLSVTAAVAASLATAALGLAGSPQASAAESAATQHDASHAPHAGAASPSRPYIRPLYRRLHAAPVNQTDVDRIDEARTHRFADETPADGVKSGTLHYDHGPTGLSTDVPTIGYSHKH